MKTRALLSILGLAVGISTMTTYIHASEQEQSEFKRPAARVKGVANAAREERQKAEKAADEAELAATGAHILAHTTIKEAAILAAAAIEAELTSPLLSEAETMLEHLNGSKLLTESAAAAANRASEHTIYSRCAAAIAISTAIEARKSEENSEIKTAKETEARLADRFVRFAELATVSAKRTAVMAELKLAEAKGAVHIVKAVLTARESKKRKCLIPADNKITEQKG